MTNLIKTVTSMQNPTLKNVRALDQRKTRKETKQFLAEGLKVIASAQEQNWQPKILVFEEGTAERGLARSLVDWALEKGAEVLQVPYDLMERLSSRDNPQHMMAVFEQRWRSEAFQEGLWIVLEEARDPGNVGTIIRTADAAGAKGVILVGNCCDPYALESVRASMGSIFAVKLMKQTKDEFRMLAKDWNGDIVATHLQGAEDYRKDYGAGPWLLLMGGEGPGLSDDLHKLAKSSVKIPMRGNADSLNLAVATALVTYEILKDEILK